MMRTFTKYPNWLILFFFACSSASVNAATITNVTFNQVLVTTDGQHGNQVSSTPFAGNSIPANGSLSLIAPYGGAISASYNFSADDSLAFFDINAGYTANDWDRVSAQTPNGNSSPITFTATQPLVYTISVSHFYDFSGTGIPGTATFAILDGPFGRAFDIGLRENDPNTYMSGTLLPSANPYSFTTLIQGGIGNSLALPIPNGVLSGTGHITLTLTAVPLPGTYLMMLTGLVMIGFAVSIHRHSRPCVE